MVYEVVVAEKKVVIWSEWEVETLYYEGKVKVKKYGWDLQIPPGSIGELVHVYKAQSTGSLHQFDLHPTNMKFIIIACVAAVAFAAPQYSSSEEVEFVPILKDDRVQEDDGTYSFDFETGNGISFSQAGSPDGDEDAVIKAGEYSYTAPDGTEIHLRFVADDNGFQPEGDHLPVAPEFPHPIPQFVLDQIAFAAEEDAARADSDEN
ncbi:larval cuticle protein LCP-17-like [Penaeus chinensis]|uniref:larval cuticle protein LCP-17-like n=1 Tax=Penaeus chinensis TaxID=139456 RepID=UPI001FB83015|nr:larval cuticle protein LCP-17-like [Penaeus chinensis]